MGGQRWAFFETCNALLRQGRGPKWWISMLLTSFRGGGSLPEVKVGLFRNLYYYAETMGGPKSWFSRLFSKLVILCWDNGWSKVGLFSKLVLLCWDNGRAKVMIFKTFFKTCITMLRQWVVKSGAVFETCISMLRQWEGKSDEFPCFLQESY